MARPATAGEKRVRKRRIIERPRLIALLDESPARIKSLVAPAGYGKTTLAEQWAATEGRRSTWFTARPSSVDVAALVMDLAHAACVIVPDCDVRLREHLRALPAPAENVDTLAELLSADLRAWPPDAWLVIDDYHELSAAPEAEYLVERLVALAPIQVLIGSRQRPAWITARTLLYGETFELGQPALAMDEIETAAVLSDREPAFRSGLRALAGGWPAVIGLASVSAADVTETTPVPEALYEFFAQEVFAALDEDVQSGLGMLAISPRLDRQLASAILHRDAERICAAALDVGILSERGASLEIHPLARAFLEDRRERGGESADADAVRQCLEYFREHLDWDAAFDLVVCHRLAEELERLVSDALDELLETGRLSTLESWCELAGELALEGPVFSLARSELALRRGRFATAEAHAEVVASVEPTWKFRAHLIAGRAAHLESREEDALKHFRHAEANAATESELRNARWGQALCMLDLELPEALSAVEEFAASVTPGNPSETVRAVACRTAYWHRFGHLDLTEADRAFQLLPMIDDPLQQTGFLSMYAPALVASARYADAREAARMFLDCVERFRLDFALPWALSASGTAAAGVRNWAVAEDMLRRGLSEAVRAGNQHAEHQCMAALVRALGQQGQFDAALAVGPLTYSTLDAVGPLQATRTALLGSRGLVLAASGRLHLATEAIADAREQSRSSENRMLIAAIDAVVALRSHGEDALSRAAALGELALSTGSRDILVVAYRTVPELLPMLLRTGDGDRLRDLVRAVGDADLAVAMGDGASHGRPESLLTGREQEVYRLLRQGLTNREIAEALVITHGTAKLHVHHILEKLGLTSRKEIAVQALIERAVQATSAIDVTGAGSDSDPDEL